MAYFSAFSALSVDIKALFDDGIKAVSERVLKNLPHAEFEGKPEDETEMSIEYLRKQYAARKTKVLEVATIKLRAIALGR